MSRPAPDDEAAPRTLGFDPPWFVDGIEGADDPILQVRPPVDSIPRRLRN